MAAEKYSEDYNISCYRTDCHRILRPSAFLDCAQDIATNAAKALDFGDEALHKCGCVWVLAKMQVRFLRPVHFEEKVRLYTWHKGLHGVNFLRDYQMCDENGIPVVNSTSSWIIMNTETRRLTRDVESLGFIPSGPQSPDNAIEESCPKIFLPKGGVVESIGEHKVKYSDVDFNGHVNNVKYSVWAMDAVPEDVVYNKFLKELTINFNSEAHPGEVVELFRTEVGDGSFIVEGRSGEHQTFIVKLTFEPFPDAFGHI